MTSFFKKLNEESEAPEEKKEAEKKRLEPAKKNEPEGEGPEGELAIDIYETEKDLVIQSTIAGIEPEDLDISIENDILTIRGKRKKTNDDNERNYLYQECYWGPFSKTVILPEEVDDSRIQAITKNGILTLRMPKVSKKKGKKILIKEEESRESFEIK